MEYYKELVNCKKIIHKLVSLYKTCECDIEAPDIHRFLRVDGLSTGLSGIGASHIIFIFLPLFIKASIPFYVKMYLK